MEKNDKTCIVPEICKLINSHFSHPWQLALNPTHSTLDFSKCSENLLIILPASNNL